MLTARFSPGDLVRVSLGNFSSASVRCFDGLLGVIIDVDNEVVFDEVECFYGISLGECVQWFWESELVPVVD